MKKTDVFLAFLGGALAGGIIALLTSPNSGAENRKIIAGKIKEGADLTKRELEELGGWIKEKLQNNDYVEELDEIIEEVESCGK